MHADMPGRVIEPSAQMGQLLLRGFAMLAAVCDDCQYPLMRDPQTMVSHCVGCRRLFDADGNAQDAPATAPAANGPVANGPMANGPLSSTQPANGAAAAAANTSGGSGTSRQGPPAAAANGPVVLTYAAHMQQQQQQVDSDEERETAEIRQRLEQHRMRQQQQQRMAAANGSNAVVDPSQLLADKLLAGWAMLAQSCPICHTPLMRSRAGEVRCIACDMPVVIERQQQQQQQQGTPAPPPAAAAGVVPPPAAAQPTAAAQPATAAQLTTAAQPTAAAVAATPSTPAAAPPASTPGAPPRAARSAQIRPNTERQRKRFELLQGLRGSAAPPPATPQQQQGLPGLGQERSLAAAAAGGAVGAGRAGDTTVDDGDVEMFDSTELLQQEQQVLRELLQAFLVKLDDSKQQLMLIPASHSETLMQQLSVIQKLVQTLETVKQAMQS